MVYPVHNYTFKIGAPVSNGTPVLNTVIDVESMEPKIKGTVKSWNPMDQNGWDMNVMTGKTMSIEFKGKRNYGDAGNDFVAGKLSATGNDCAAVLDITMPNGDTLSCNGLIDLTQPFGGASTDMDTLNWTYTLSGKPTYTAAGTNQSK